MREKPELYRIIWAVITLIWLALDLFWHSQAVGAKIFMMIYTLVLVIWDIGIIVQSRKHRKNRS